MSLKCACLQMRPDIEQYFSDALDVLKKQQKMIIQVLEFQKKHRDRYIAHLKEHVSTCTL